MGRCGNSVLRRVGKDVSATFFFDAFFDVAGADLKIGVVGKINRLRLQQAIDPNLGARRAAAGEVIQLQIDFSFDGIHQRRGKRLNNGAHARYAEGFNFESAGILMVDR